MNQFRSHYDVVIIGAGLGGLSAGVSLSKSGRSVLVVERNPQPGGNCSMRSIGPYRFDVALHEFTGGAPGGEAGAIFEEFGVAGEIDFREIDPFMVVDMPDASYPLPTSTEAFRDFLVDRFPHERSGIERLMVRVDEIRRDSLIGQRLVWGDSPAISDLLDRELTLPKYLTFPVTMARAFLRHADQTALDMLSEFVRDPRLVGVLTAPWPYLGAPPHVFGAFLFSLWVSCHGTERQHYPVGGSQKIADVLAGAVRRYGGDVLLDTEVTRLVVKGGRARGVELGGQHQVTADVVVSNIAPRYLLEKLVDPGEAPALYLNKLRRMRPSIGPFVVYLGVDLDIAKSDLPHETIVYDAYDQTDVWSRMERGLPAGFSIYSPAHVDTSFAPPGHGTVTLTTMFPWRTEQDWRTHEDAVADEMIARAEKRVPGLASHVKVRRILTPEKLQAFSHATDGAMYGWENSPEQVVTRRMPQRLPIENLYQVGHWTQPGTGMNATVMSGWRLGHHLRREQSRSRAWSAISAAIGRD
jgi:phytoene desaturase